MPTREFLNWIKMGKTAYYQSEGPAMSKTEKVKETAEFHLPPYLPEAAMRPAT